MAQLVCSYTPICARCDPFRLPANSSPDEVEHVQVRDRPSSKRKEETESEGKLKANEGLMKCEDEYNNTNATDVFLL